MDPKLIKKRDVYNTLLYGKKGNNKVIACLGGNAYSENDIKQYKELESDNIKIFFEDEFETWLKQQK